MSLPTYASRGPIPFLLHYIRRRLAGHLIVITAVLAAVGCAIGSQYAVKNLVDMLEARDRNIWIAVGILFGLVAGDNLLWRLAGWVSTNVFVAVGGDVRLELTWTTIPPLAAVFSSILLLATVNWQITAVLTVIVAILGAIIWRLAARGSPLHEDFAGRAAAVNGYLADVVGNIGLVRTFGTARREHAQLTREIEHEMTAQRASLRSLERLRIFHALSVLAVTAGILIWSITLWRQGKVTTGDVVLTTTLGFTVLHASRDLAMALVDVVQQFAKLGEAVQELGLPHEMQDAPDAKPLINLGGSAALVNVCFSYPNGARVLQDFTLHIPAGQKIGIVGKSGAGKSTIFALMQRFYDPEYGHVLIDQQDIALVTQESLRQSIAVVQQDIGRSARICAMAGPRRPMAKSSKPLKSPIAWSSSTPCPMGSTRWWVSAGPSCRVASASVWRLPAPFCARRRSSCWTRRHRRWTPMPSSRYRRPWPDWCAAAP
jgi:ATP-binding cassette, subfamily B, bacterial